VSRRVDRSRAKNDGVSEELRCLPEHRAKPTHRVPAKDEKVEGHSQGFGDYRRFSDRAIQ